MVSKFYGVVVGVAALLLPLASQAQPIRPQVVPESRINVRFYEVSAAQPDQLDQAIAQSAPKVNGKPVLGKASYQLDWQLETDQLQGLCQLSRVTVTTRATVELPAGARVKVVVKGRTTRQIRRVSAGLACWPACSTMSPASRRWFSKVPIRLAAPLLTCQLTATVRHCVMLLGRRGRENW